MRFRVVVKFPNEGDGGHSRTWHHPDTVEPGVHGERNYHRRPPDAKGLAIAPQVDPLLNARLLRSQHRRNEYLWRRARIRELAKGPQS
jgi:hypothetical protein